MAVDNRTLLNNCSATTGWTGDDSATVITDTGQFYEGSSALSTQLSNSDEQMSTTSIGGTRNLAASTCYMLIKDNLVESFANGGVQYVLGDGTDLIGYDVGGYDRRGLALPFFYNSYKIDVSVRVATPGTNFTNFAGTEANLAQTAITRVGYGTIHLAKAVGAIDNVFMDAFRFGLNNAYHMTINTGSSGTPETFDLVVTDDITGGWGMIGNPQGKQYNIFASFEWGDTANGNSYFRDSNFQVFLLGTGMGTGNFIVRTIAGSGTNGLELTSGVFVNIDTPAVIDFSDADMNTFEFDSMTFTDVGTISFPPSGGTSRFVNDSIFNNCGQITFQSLSATRNIFNGSTDADGAVLWSTTPADVANQTDFTYNSDGTGHAIEISLNTASLTTYNISGYTFDSYAGQDGTAGNRVFLIDNALDGDVTINLTDCQALNQVGTGNGFSYEAAAGYTGTVTIVSTVTLTLTGIQTDSEVRIINLDDTTNFNKELTGIAQILGEVQSAEIVSGGSGYTNGSQTLTVVGGTGTAATLDVTVAGGAVTSVDAIAGAGSYSVNPTNPVSTTGGGGTGATFNLDISGEFSYNYDSGNLVRVAIIVFHIDFVEVRIEQDLSATSQTIPIQQRGDRVYNNP